MGAPDEWPSRRLASRQNPAYRPADMVFLARACWEEVLRILLWCYGAGGQSDRTEFVAAPGRGGAIFPSPCPSRGEGQGEGRRHTPTTNKLPPSP